MEPVNFSSEVVGTDWVPKIEFSGFLKKRYETKEEKIFLKFLLRAEKVAVRTTLTSEPTGVKTRLPITFRITVKSNFFDLVDSSIRKGPGSIVFSKIFLLERFRSGFLH